jgi:hypothetical protein
MLFITFVRIQREAEEPLGHGRRAPGYLSARLHKEEKALHHNGEIDNVAHHAPQNIRSISGHMLFNLSRPQAMDMNIRQFESFVYPCRENDAGSNGKCERSGGRDDAWQSRDIKSVQRAQHYSERTRHKSRGDGDCTGRPSQT